VELLPRRDRLGCVRLTGRRAAGSRPPGTSRCSGRAGFVVAKHDGSSGSSRGCRAVRFVQSERRARLGIPRPFDQAGAVLVGRRRCRDLRRSRENASDRAAVRGCAPVWCIGHLLSVQKSRAPASSTAPIDRHEYGSPVVRRLKNATVTRHDDHASRDEDT